MALSWTLMALMNRHCTAVQWAFKGLHGTAAMAVPPWGCRRIRMGGLYSTEMAVPWEVPRTAMGTSCSWQCHDSFHGLAIAIGAAMKIRGIALKAHESP